MMKRFSVTELNILVVDDSDINRQLLLSILEKEGAKVMLAIDGENALKKVELTSFDLILIDIDMPGRDGIATTRELRKREQCRGTRIFAITASGASYDRAVATEIGLFDRVLNKSISKQELLHTITQKLSPEKSQDNVSEILAPLDMAHALRATGGNRELLSQLHQMLEKEITEKCSELDQALANSEFESAAKLLHKMQGSASYCGALPFQSAAQLFEKELIDNGPAYVPDSRLSFANALIDLKVFLGSRHQEHVH